MIQRRGKKKSVHYIFFFRLIRKALLHIFSDDFNIDKLLQAIIAASLSREVRIMNARVKGEQRDNDQTVTRCEGRLRLAELAKHGIDRVESGIDLFADLRMGHQRSDRGDIADECTLAPVKTILPETKMSKTTLGLIMR